MKAPSIEDKNHIRESFKRMSAKKKAEYIFTYYKLPITVLVIATIVLFSFVYKVATKKDVYLYVGLLNVSISEDTEDKLTSGFIEAAGVNPKKTEILLYKDLYITDDANTENHEYSYASKLKTLATINSKQLDLVIMNNEASNIFYENGYLLDGKSIDFSDYKIIKDAGFSESVYAGIIANSTRIENTRSYLAYLLEGGL